MVAAACIHWCSRPLCGGHFVDVGRVVDRLRRAAAAAGSISGALCGSAAGSLAEESAFLMNRAEDPSQLAAEARDALGCARYSDFACFT